MQRHPMSQAAHERQLREREHHASPSSTAITTMPLNLAKVHELATQPLAPTASIYLPTHRTGPDRQQDHILAKNLLHAAQRMLHETASGRHSADLIAPATAALDHADFWAHPDEGLALFCRESGFQYLWLPATTPELAVVSQHAHIKPLMPLLQNDGQFYLLDLTQHGVHLFVGSRFSLLPVELPNAPASLDEALGHPDAERHSGVRLLNAAGQGSSRNFGTVGDERAKERIKEYFQRIDTCVCALLHGQRAPLITAGVEYLLPLYREANHYPHLVQAGIPGNPDTANTTARHDRAWTILAPHFAKAAGDARERYAQLRGSARAADSLAEVLRAAAQGRVEELFVAQDAACWGHYEALDNQLRTHESRQPDDDDLLNLALITALASHARVHVLPQAQMPDQQLIAAVLRY